MIPVQFYVSHQGQTAAIDMVLHERLRQDQKWGTVDTFDGRSMHKWLTILSEEHGEVAEAILEQEHANTIKELTQVAAVAVAMIESLQRRNLNSRTDANI